MYSKTAQYYDLLYSYKNYEKECDYLTDLLAKKNVPAKTILDVGCGSGEHAKFLSKNYAIDGIDLSSEFIAIAKEKVPSGNFTVSNMTNFNLNKTYDVIICLFSAIGYITNALLLIDTLICFKKHLNPHGIIVIEPWFTKDQWTYGVPHMQTVSQPQLKICRMSTSRLCGTISKITFDFLIGTAHGVTHCTEEHELALYSHEEMVSFCKKAGLTAEYITPGLTGRGLYSASGFMETRP